MTTKNKLNKYFSGIVVTLSLLMAVIFAGIVKAESSNVYAIVAYNGQNLPINVSNDKTALFERKYDKHNDMDKVLSNWALIGFEVVVMVALVALLLEIKKAIPKVEDALSLSKKKA